MMKVFARYYSLQEWLLIAFLQSVIGGTALALVHGLWVGVSERTWSVLAAFAVTVVVAVVTALLWASLSYGIYRALHTKLKGRSDADLPQPMP